MNSNFIDRAALGLVQGLVFAVLGFLGWFFFKRKRP